MHDEELGSDIQFFSEVATDGSEAAVEYTEVHDEVVGSDIQLFSEVATDGSEAADEYTEVDPVLNCSWRAK